MKKRILSIVLVVGVLFSLVTALPLTASAAESGTCGKNLEWNLDDEGTLTISGTGKMTNYEYKSKLPWYSSRSKIKTIIIGDEVTSISDYAFYECKSVTSINIPNSIISIGSRAFVECSGLTSIAIPESVTSIGLHAFSTCYNLTGVSVDSNNKYYSSEDGILFDKAKTKLIFYPRTKTETTYIIPDSVTTICNAAFKECKSLTSIDIPNSVTTIEQSAFEDCRSLTAVNIPDGVTSISNDTFSSCQNLTSVDIPDDVTYIGRFAFSECISLTSITLPAKLTSIDYAGFSSCEKITNIDIPDGVTSISNVAFAGCSSLTSITFPHSLTFIGVGVFNNCTKLETVYYKGSEADWNNISTESGSTLQIPAEIIFICADTEIVAAVSGDNSLKFATKATISGSSEIESFGTTFIPLWLFETGSTEFATVTYQNAKHNIQNGQIFGATLSDIPEEYYDTDIVAMSFIKQPGDNNYTWSSAKYASVNDTTLKSAE